MTSSVDIVNRALELIASQSQIATLGDGTPEAIAASSLYASMVLTLLRESDPEFARRTIPLTLGGAASVPWTYAYAYPGDCVRLRQIMPPVPSANDPVAVRWSVQESFSGQVAMKVIMTNQQFAMSVYTTSLVTEDQWDSVFTEAAVRMLASEMAMPIGGRPDFAEKLLNQSGEVLSGSMGRDS